MELYKAPAHRHAHHLHSIPPREKTTRTLILDHLLWGHANARIDSRAAEANPLASVPYGPDRRRIPARPRLSQPAASRESTARAEGLEKVICAMLQQPSDPSHATHGPSHSVLPNGVRLRLALGTLVNELFAEQPHPPAAPQDMSFIASAAFGSSPLPAPIANLVSISSYNALSATALSSAIASSSPVRPSSVLGMSSYELPSPALPFNSVNRATPTSFKVFGRTRHLYLQGAAAGSSHEQRCTRHLIASCDACALQPRQSAAVSIGSGLMHPHSSAHAFPFRSQRYRKSGSSHSRLADLIPSFLRLSALVAIELGREATEQRDENDPEHDSDVSSNEGDDHDLEHDHDLADRLGSTRSSMSPFNHDIDGMDSQSRADTAISGHDIPLQAFPTRHWFSLAANLFTLAALEGYLLRGWRGPDGAEVVLGIGVGQNPDDEPGRSSDHSNHEPDGMPSLTEAAKALFGGLLDDDGSGSSRSNTPTTAEAFAYREEMNTRMTEFFSIAAHTPNLGAHLDALVATYPMDPMEQLALYFCKAVARWRGKPELETYQKSDGASQLHDEGPNILDFFVVRDPSQLRQHQNKRKRSAGSASLDGMQPPRKRMFTSHEEEEWVGPYGV